MKNHLLFLLLLQPFTFRAQTICGYPGDANHDGRADYLDVLAVGLAYNNIFEPRPDPGNTWQLNCFQAWPQLLPGTVLSAGFADSDGSGHVDSLDIDAIALNYDSLHSAGIPPVMPWQPPPFPVTSCPLIWLDLYKDQFNTRKFYADILFEPDPNAFPGALGIGMQLLYPPEYIENDSVRIIFLPENPDLMGAGSAPAQVSFERSLPPGLVEVAVAGRGQNALTLPRRLATVAFIVVEEVILRSDDTIQFQIDFGDIILVNNQGLRICTEQKSETIGMIVGASEIYTSPDYFNLHPNPAGTYIDLDLPPGLNAEKIYLRDLRGRLVGSYPAAPVLLLDNIPPGAYFVQIQYAKGSISKKLVILPY